MLEMIISMHCVKYMTMCQIFELFYMHVLIESLRVNLCILQIWNALQHVASICLFILPLPSSNTASVGFASSWVAWCNVWIAVC